MATSGIAIWQTTGLAHVTRCFKSKAFKIVRRDRSITMADLRRSYREHFFVGGGIRSTPCGNRVYYGVDSSDSRNRRIDLSRLHIPGSSAAGLISSRNNVVAPRRRNAAVYSVAEFNFARMSIQAVMSTVVIGIEKLLHLSPPDPGLIGDLLHRVFTRSLYELILLFICQRLSKADFLSFEYGRLLESEFLIFLTGA
jgi:hypothetical protein